MGAAGSEPLVFPLALALHPNELTQRLDRLDLSQCLAQEAARRARLQAAAFQELLCLPELARQLCFWWGLKASRALAMVSQSCGGVRGLLEALHVEAEPHFFVLGGCLATAELSSAQRYDRDGWHLLPPMPTERRWCAGAALAGHIYVIGGQQEGQVLSSAERFDVEANVWEQLPPMPTCREACAVASCGGQLYVLGGCQHDVPVATAERLDAESLCWETLQDMPCSRDACAAASLGGRVYVVGGRSSGHFLASADALDTTSVGRQGWRWARLAPMPTARLGCFAAAAGSSVYVAGGHAGHGRALSVVERFDVTLGRWEKLTEMPSARLGAVGLCWQPKRMPKAPVIIYIFGGHNGSGATDLAQRLQLDSDGVSNPRWQTLSPMIAPCYACAGAVAAW